MPTADSNDTTSNESPTERTEVIEASREPSSEDTHVKAEDASDSSDNVTSNNDSTPHESEPVTGENEAAERGHAVQKNRFWRNFDWIATAVAATVIIVPMILWGEFAREYRNVWLIFVLLFAVAMIIKIIYCLVTNKAIELWLLLLPLLFAIVSFVLMELQIAVWMFTNLVGDDRRRRGNAADWFFGLPMGLLKTVFIIGLIVLFGYWIYSSLKKRHADPDKAPHAGVMAKVVVLALLIILIIATDIVAVIGALVTVAWLWIVAVASVLATVMILAYLVKRQRFATFWSGFWTVTAAILLLLPLGWSALMVKADDSDRRSSTDQSSVSAQVNR